MKTQRVMLILVLLLQPSWAAAQTVDAKELIRLALDHWRGSTSYVENTMTIHRPDWERTMSMVGWTEGSENSLMRVTAPAKDAGNGTLLKDNNMWSYTPRINRIIKVPSSMMNQSWMGSDFSNKDINKATDLLKQYDHSLLETREQDGHTIYVIEAIPHEDAAVVWGKEVAVIRDDFVLLRQEFWDQAGVLVKAMETLEIQEISGRTVATIMRMSAAATPDEWTQVAIEKIEFDIDLPGNLFTLSSLRNPRQ